MVAVQNPTPAIEFLTEPEDLGVRIEGAVNPVKFLEARVKEWTESDTLIQMIDGQRYYENQNTMILNRQRVVHDRGGANSIPAWLAQIQLPHNFARKLCRQQVSYMLGRPVKFKSDDQALRDYVTLVLDEDFDRALKSTATDAVNKGVGWMQAYYDPSGKLCFKRIPAHEVIPFWGDDDHTQLLHAIRVYEVQVFTDEEAKVVRHAQWFRSDGIYQYVEGDDGWLDDPDNPHIGFFQMQQTQPAGMDPILNGGETVTPEGEAGFIPPVEAIWTQLPLIAIKYNQEESSLLASIKPQLDDYDRHRSEMSCKLAEEIEQLLVVTGYDGTDKDEFMVNFHTYKVMFVREGGSVQTLSLPVSIEQELHHITQLRRDIYEFGGGVDIQSESLGNASGVAIKFRYSDLDLVCDAFAQELYHSFRKIMWFIKQDALLKHAGDFTESKITAECDMSVTINETETIDDINNSRGLVSDETLLEQHPFVSDVNLELDRMAKQTTAQSTLLTGGTDYPTDFTPIQADEGTATLRSGFED